MKVLVKAGGKENANFWAIFFDAIIPTRYIRSLFLTTVSRLGLPPSCVQVDPGQIGFLKHFETYKDACQYLYGPLRVFDINDRQLLTDIKQAARDRIGPFVTQ